MPFHYTYRLTSQNPIDDRVEYIGVRSCECDPANDTAYMSSSREVKALIRSGMVFVKEIIATWPNRKAAVAHEVSLHAEHNVAHSPRFFNKAKQTSVGFDTAGTQTGDNNCMSRVDVKIRHSKIVADFNYRKRVSDGVKKAFENPEVADRVNAAKAEAVRRPEVRAKIGAKSKAAQAKPEVKTRHSAATKRALLSPEINARLRAGHRTRWGNIDERSAQSVRIKTAYRNDPTLAARTSHLGEQNGMYGASHSQTAIEVMRVKRKECALLKAQFCAANGISDPGKGYCNVDKQAFASWLSANKKEAA